MAHDRVSLQWIWPIPLILVSFFAPESPWWLVRKGRIEEARQNLVRLTSRTAEGQNDDFDVDQTIAMMRHTHMLEQRVSYSSSSLALIQTRSLNPATLTSVSTLTFCSTALPRRFLH